MQLTRALAVMSAFLVGVVGAGADAPRLLFRADFEGTLAPEVGTGPLSAANAQAKFAEGIRGKGYVADGSVILAYPSQVNLRKDRGTVCMWVRPTWAGTDGQNHGFFADDLNFNDPPRNNLFLWKWVHGDSLRFDIRTADLRDITYSVASWKPGEWHHLAAAWDCETGTQLFHDGRLVGVCHLRWQPKQGTKFFLGADWSGGAPAMATIDEVCIFDAPLNEGQVERVMRNQSIPAVTLVKTQAPHRIVLGNSFEVTLSLRSDDTVDDPLPLEVTLDGLSLPGPSGGVRLNKEKTTTGTYAFHLPGYYRLSSGQKELRVGLRGAHIVNPEASKLAIAVSSAVIASGRPRWSFTPQGSVLRNGKPYLEPGMRSAIWWNGEVRPYDAATQRLCSRLVQTGSIVDVIPCRLLDSVQGLATDHGFREWGQSEVVTLGDGRAYRMPGLPETVQEQRVAYGRKHRLLPGFAYRLRCQPRPTQHLVVVETLNDAERCLETAIDVAPGSQPSELLKAAGIGAGDLINLHVTYTGREYPTDGRPLQQVTLFFPKSDAVEVTISDSRRAAERPAVHRISVYEITADLSELAVETDGNLRTGRTVSLFYPWCTPLYEEYGFSSGTEGSRRGSVTGLMQYLRFMGFNRLEFHPYRFSRHACFPSKLFPSGGRDDIFKDILPVAAEYGIEVVPRVDAMCFYFSGQGAEQYAKRTDLFQVTRQGKTLDYFGTVPDPIHPEVQSLLCAMLREMAEKTKGWKNAPAVGFRANGKFGTLYVGTDRAHPPEESGYSEFDISEFEKDTGTLVGGTPGNAGSRYEWLRANAWERWIEWRCRRIHDHWLRCRDAIREVDPTKKLVVFTKIPSNDPGEKRDWERSPVPLLDLHKFHGYNPALFVNDTGISLSRVMGVDADRYWPEKWNKLYFFQPELSSFFRSREPSGVELYYIYWELCDHPKGLRVGPGAPRGRAFYEPMTHALRLQNPGHFTFYNWYRATMGHEQDLRQFCRAFRALPLVEPRPFEGHVAPDEIARDDTLSVRWYGDRLAIINDSAKARTIQLAMPPKFALRGLLDIALGSPCAMTGKGRERKVSLALRPWDLRTLVPRQ